MTCSNVLCGKYIEPTDRSVQLYKAHRFCCAECTKAWKEQNRRFEIVTKSGEEPLNYKKKKRD